MPEDVPGVPDPRPGEQCRLLLGIHRRAEPEGPLDLLGLLQPRPEVVGELLEKIASARLVLGRRQQDAAFFEVDVGQLKTESAGGPQPTEGLQGDHAGHAGAFRLLEQLPGIIQGQHLDLLGVLAPELDG